MIDLIEEEIRKYPYPYVTKETAITLKHERDEATKEIKRLNSLVPKELKHKKEVPTVIEYHGRRYVLDYKN